MYKAKILIEDVCCEKGKALLEGLTGEEALVVFSLDSSPLIILTEAEYLNMKSCLSVLTLLARHSPEVARELDIELPTPIAPNRNLSAEEALEALRLVKPLLERRLSKNEERV